MSKFTLMRLGNLILPTFGIGRNCDFFKYFNTNIWAICIYSYYTEIRRALPARGSVPWEGFTTATSTATTTSSVHVYLKHLKTRFWRDEHLGFSWFAPKNLPSPQPPLPKAWLRGRRLEQKLRHAELLLGRTTYLLERCRKMQKTICWKFVLIVIAYYIIL